MNNMCYKSLRSLEIRISIEKLNIRKPKFLVQHPRIPQNKFRELLNSLCLEGVEYAGNKSKLNFECDDFNGLFLFSSYVYCLTDPNLKDIKLGIFRHIIEEGLIGNIPVFFL